MIAELRRLPATHATFKVSKRPVCLRKTFSLRAHRLVAEGTDLILSSPMNVTTTAGSAPHEEPHYSIVIPVYNEEDVVGRLLDELRSFARTWSSDYELLLVDDGSSDRTAEIIGNQFVNWSQGRLIQA